MANNNDAKENKKVDTNQRHYFHGRRPWLVVAGVILLLFIIMAGMSAAFWAGSDRFGHDGFRGLGTERGFMMGEHRYGGNFELGNSDSSNRLNGVVTSVNGSSFTVAGHGSTNNVETSSSTQYQGGNSVKVNDSVVVFGTTNNGTLQATQVVINP